MTAAKRLSHRRLRDARELPGARKYPEFTPRVRQAAELYVVEGMPVRLIADEMGIGEHAVRGYIKKTYEILESYHDDEQDYRDIEMNQQEVGFMRLTALELSGECLQTLRKYGKSRRQ